MIWEFICGFCKKTVGRQIKLCQIQQLIYTKSSSSLPCVYQRFHFLKEDERKRFHYVYKTGNHWPLKDEDIVDSGTIDLSDQQWMQLTECLKGGTVSKKEKSVDSGDAGPWLTLYWDNDRGMNQTYSFSSLDDLHQFEQFCHLLMQTDLTSKHH